MLRASTKARKPAKAISDHKQDTILYKSIIFAFPLRVYELATSCTSVTVDLRWRMLKWRQRWRKMVKESQSHQNLPLRGLPSPWRSGTLWPCGSGTWSVTRVPSVEYKWWVSKELVSCPDANFHEEKSLVTQARILRFADVLKPYRYCNCVKSA